MGKKRMSGLMAIALSMLLVGCGGSSRVISPTPTFLPRPGVQTTALPCSANDALDSRISAPLLIASYYNAIDRGEWARAYSYLSSPDGVSASPLPDFAQWRDGYAATACILVTFAGDGRTVTSMTPGYTGIGTGFEVPVWLIAVGRDGGLTLFAGTYAVRYDPQRGIALTGAIALDYSRINPL